MKTALYAVAWVLFILALVLSVKGKTDWSLACYTAFLLILLIPTTWKKGD